MIIRDQHKIFPVSLPHLNQIRVDSMLESGGPGLKPMAGLLPMRPLDSIVHVGCLSSRVWKNANNIRAKNAVKKL